MQIQLRSVRLPMLSAKNNKDSSQRAKGTAMQIADWLQKLGMSEYAQRFAENRIDISVLPDLTDQDLEKMGVVLGDRRKILRAIALIGSEAPAVPQAAAADASPRQDSSERRQLTVMFT